MRHAQALLVEEHVTLLYADMSEEARAARIRDHPPPPHDHKEVARKASGAAIGFGLDIMLSLWGMSPRTAKESKQD